jgi:hypothetical protein
MPLHPGVIGLIARKQCLNLAQTLLKAPLFFNEPIAGVALPEVNYYTFTLVNVLNSPALNAIKLTGVVSDTILPTLWNYLDGACALSVGLSQLLDEDNHRQIQMKTKGILNIISGIQLFVLSYNPPLAAALGVSGVPAVLAGASFALAMLIDLITASIDFYNAFKEQEINGWLEETSREYDFISQRMATLQAENDTLSTVTWTTAQTLWETNNQKIQALETKQQTLLKTLKARYKIHQAALSENQKASLQPWLGNLQLWEEEPITAEERHLDSQIQRDLNANFQKAKDTLMVRAASFIGMSLLAVGTLALFTQCPPAIPVIGLAITVVVASIYLYRHQQEIGHFLQSTFSFFKASVSKDNPESQPLLGYPMEVTA